MAKNYNKTEIQYFSENSNIWYENWAIYDENRPKVRQNVRKKFKIKEKITKNVMKISFTMKIRKNFTEKTCENDYDLRNLIRHKKAVQQ